MVTEADVAKVVQQLKNMKIKLEAVKEQAAQAFDYPPTPTSSLRHLITGDDQGTEMLEKLGKMLQECAGDSTRTKFTTAKTIYETAGLGAGELSALEEEERKQNLDQMQR